jgi:hypothetical protein
MTSKSLLTEFVENPLPFALGFVSGLFHLDIEQDPMKTWLAEQGFSPKPPSGPQNISIE